MMNQPRVSYPLHRPGPLSIAALACGLLLAAAGVSRAELRVTPRAACQMPTYHYTRQIVTSVYNGTAYYGNLYYADVSPGVFTCPLNTGAALIPSFLWVDYSMPALGAAPYVAIHRQSWDGNTYESLDVINGGQEFATQGNHDVGKALSFTNASMFDYYEVYFSSLGTLFGIGYQ